jgi:hypothetical protein
MELLLLLFKRNNLPCFCILFAFVCFLIFPCFDFVICFSLLSYHENKFELSIIKFNFNLPNPYTRNLFNSPISFRKVYWGHVIMLICLPS